MARAGCIRSRPSCSACRSSSIATQPDTKVRFDPRMSRYRARGARQYSLSAARNCSGMRLGGVGRIMETHRDDNPSCSWPDRRVHLVCHRRTAELCRNLSPLVRGVFRSRRPQLRLHVVPAMRDDGDPRHRRLVRTESLVSVVRTEQLERRRPHRPAQATRVTCARHRAERHAFTHWADCAASASANQARCAIIMVVENCDSMEGRRDCLGDSP